MGPELIGRLIDAMHRVITEHAGQLTALDQAIGDGDHGINMARGFGVLQARRDELSALPLGRALQQAGTALMTSVGGAAGPLYGALLVDMGKVAPAGTPTLAEAAAMLEAGVAAVRQSGGAGKGEKTMLDVLAPVAEALRRAADGGGRDVGTRAVAAAAHGLHQTSYMIARHGPGAALGEASKGHLDPGACSSALLVGAVVRVLEEGAGG
jgi:dihydroxyacetone kinase-like protein